MRRDRGGVVRVRPDQDHFGLVQKDYGPGPGRGGVDRSYPGGGVVEKGQSGTFDMVPFFTLNKSLIRQKCGPHVQIIKNNGQ